MFKGHFDGDGHTISGIRIYQPNDYNMGLFGYIGSGAEVKGVTLADTRITGQQNVGGLVGYSADNTTITNCHVTRTVAINYNGTKGNNHGGIVGDASGTVSGCTSSVQLTVIGSYNGAIAGVNRNVLRDNLALNATVPAAENFNAHGSISGTSFGTLQRNYYNACTVAGVKNATGKGCENADVTANDGAVPGYFLTLGEGVTSSALSITIPEHKDLNGSGELVTVAAVTYNVAAAGTTVSFKIADDGYLGSYSVNGTPISGNSITMPAENVTVTSTGEPIDVWGIAGGADGSSEHPYIITTTAGWDLLAGNVSAGKSYSGKYFQLGADNIRISSMVGTSDHPFSGIFNGNGHTLVIDMTSTGEYTAPFRYVSGATIKNLRTSGTITASHKYATGLIGRHNSDVSVTNCRSSVTIVSSVKGDGTHGGFIATGSGTATISGCVFDGVLCTTEKDRTNNCGGFVGWRGTLNISNSLYAPAAVPEGKYAIATSGSCTFARPDTTPTNSYYTAPPSGGWGAAQGKKAYALTTAPANLGAAVTGEEITVLTAYANGILFDGKYYVAPAAVTLADNAANDLSGVNGYVADVTLSGRKLWKDGAWNTLCLPFSIADFDGTIFADADIRALSSASLSDDGVLTLNFTPAAGDGAVTSITAGTPYIVKWDGSEGQYTENPVFTDVTISSTTAGSVTSTDENVQFLGTYSPAAIDNGNKACLFLGAANTLYWPNADNYQVGAFRAYFKVDLGGGLGAYPAPSEVRQFVLNFGDEEIATGIQPPSPLKGEHLSTPPSGGRGAGWYTLDGVRLDGQPTKKGLYIHGGKKVAIK